MTDDKDPGFRIGGRPLAERLTEVLPSLAKTVLSEIVLRIPEYGLLPAEELSGDITHVIEQNLRSFIDTLRTGATPSRPELDFLRESAARRAEEGIPIDIVLTAYHIGIQVVWASLTPDARPDEVADVLAVNALTLRYLEVVTPAVGAGYLDERRTMFDDERSARHTVLSALLDGEPAEVAAGQAGLRLPPCYIVLAASVGAHPDEEVDGVDPLVAGRRKLRRLRVELERQIRGTVLTSLTPDGGLALLPHETTADELSTRDWARLERVLADVARTAGAEVIAGTAAAEPSGVPAAARLAQDVLAVATGSGRPPGLYRLDDVLLEYQLSRPGPALDRLATRLTPLDGNEELLQTLKTFLDRGGRRQAAAALHVHPNTVDYRLRRIADLTGLDPTRLEHIALLNAALSARALVTRHST
ncbi:PucR family transcriptional regulator [Amycolatopsis keratiniphila]|uniref:Transcriptional regulator n=1 Tax=Amycolatopsis keratiniphila subsp. keratiniphila TaxID=227715 RepID=A0A1W2LM17_9PSEU|nr:helix-turn-helix domain-containing protein [Amycolatopsis keratiniphila]ONF63687.1 transcriptional regulator [Amycolatopsis keratiniphila subsp. keratiniphila]